MDLRAKVRICLKLSISYYKLYQIINPFSTSTFATSFVRYFAEIPQFKDSYLIASQGMALMKVSFNATRSNPGVPMFTKASMTATALDIDCLKGKVRITYSTTFSIQIRIILNENMFPACIHFIMFFSPGILD